MNDSGTQEEHKLWKVRHMPVHTQLAIVGCARLRGLQVGQMLEVIVSEWLETNAK